MFLNKSKPKVETVLSGIKSDTAKKTTFRAPAELSQKRKAELREVVDEGNKIRGNLIDQAYVQGLCDSYETKEIKRLLTTLDKAHKALKKISTERNRFADLASETIQDLKNARDDILRGKKQANMYFELRERKDKPLRTEWEKYPKFLDDYFKRNPTHCLTDGKRACAKNYSKCLKTIQRHTSDYKKPGTL